MIAPLPDRQQVTALIRDVTAAEIMPRFKRLEAHHVSDKESGELVTEADIASEARFTPALMELAPGSTVVGEEAVSDDASVLDRLKGSAPVWIVDPLDGTRNFASGKHCFAVIIAYAVGGETVAGWIYDPLADTVIWAERGKGAWAEETQLHISSQHSASAELTGSMGKWRRERLLNSANVDASLMPSSFVRYGCTGREYMDLATSALHFAEYGMLKPWDHAAGILIHAEAGGYSAFSNDGEQYRPVAPDETNGRLLLAPNAALWQSLNEAFNPGAGM